MAAEDYPCTYEIVRGNEIVSTGRLVLEKRPVVGAFVQLGGDRLEVDDVWPASGGEIRVRLRAA